MTAIGGIAINNSHEVFNAGACGIAVISAIHNASDPYKTAKKLIASSNNNSNPEQTKLPDIQNIKKTVNNLKTKKPLILNLTNFVTMDFVANCLLSIGAAPIMCTYEDEIEELINISSAVYINIGTLDDNFIKLVEKVIIFAKQYNKPIVLDPVGCGATKIRTKVASNIAPNCQIIRGNASEIMALGNNSFLTKGVESVHKTEDSTDIADNIAKYTRSTIVVSGATDYITNGSLNKQIKFGSPIMTNITGMGCSLTAIIAAILAVTNEPFEAGVIGAQYFSLCGELVAQKHKKPGSFKSAFLDMLHSPDFYTMRELYDQ